MMQEVLDLMTEESPPSKELLPIEPGYHLACGWKGKVIPASVLSWSKKGYPRFGLFYWNEEGICTLPHRDVFDRTEWRFWERRAMRAVRNPLIRRLLKEDLYHLEARIKFELPPSVREIIRARREATLMVMAEVPSWKLRRTPKPEPPVVLRDPLLISQCRTNPEHLHLYAHWNLTPGENYVVEEFVTLPKKIEERDVSEGVSPKRLTARQITEPLDPPLIENYYNFIKQHLYADLNLPLAQLLGPGKIIPVKKS